MSGSFKLIPELKELDNLLRCGICYDYMKNALVTSCSHNYCSYCVRKFMQYKSQCPSCFKEATEPQLRNNRLVDQFISLFRKVLEKFEDLAYDHMQISDFSHQRINDEVFSNVANAQNNVDTTKTVADVPASTFRISVPDMFTPRRKAKKPPSAIAEPVRLVPCPVCSVDIPERNINLHLDHCLAKSKENAEERIASEVDRRKPLPKLVYPLLQEKDLRKKLRDLGLSALGDKKTLINRHQRYILLYNSECDSLNPRPASEIVDQVTSEERMVKSTAGHSSAPTNSWLSVDKKADCETIEVAQKQYLTVNKHSFTALVKAVKERRKDESMAGEGTSGSTSRMPGEVELRRSSDERSPSPEISVMPPVVDWPNHLQSSLDLFEAFPPSLLPSLGARDGSPKQEDGATPPGRYPSTSLAPPASSLAADREERTPSPAAFVDGCGQLCPGSPSPPVLRKKRQKTALNRSSLTAVGGEEGDPYRARLAPRGMDLQLQPDRQALRKRSKTGRKRGQAKK